MLGGGEVEEGEKERDGGDTDGGGGRVAATTAK